MFSLSVGLQSSQIGMGGETIDHKSLFDSSLFQEVFAWDQSKRTIKFIGFNDAWQCFAYWIDIILPQYTLYYYVHSLISSNGLEAIIQKEITV